MIRFGVIGLGNRGSKFALQSLIPHPEIEVVYVCDQQGTNFNLFEEKQIRSTTDYRTLLKSTDVDAVFIATPDDTHAEIILEAIKFSKHILCEKPLDISRGFFYIACRNASKRGRWLPLNTM